MAADSNAEALQWLQNTASWPSGRLALWGPEGCGKTHMLHIWVDRERAELLAGPNLVGLPPERPVAVDDADAAPERPLLHLLNAAAEAGLPVLLAGRGAPARWNPMLPDLASRLRAMTAVAIRPAEDELLRSLFSRLLSERQLTVAEPLQEWLLLRLPRSQGAIREAVARLDHAGLAAGGRITRPVARAVAMELEGKVSAEFPEDDVCIDGGTLTPGAMPGLL